MALCESARKILSANKKYCFNGRVPVEVVLKDSKWLTSMLPVGGGKQIIPILKRVRLKEKIEAGDFIKISFSHRKKKRNVSRLIENKKLTFCKIFTLFGTIGFL